MSLASFTHSDATAAGVARLPAFAGLCSRALAILGRQGPDRLALAAPIQRQWHASAEATLSEMGRRGARMPGFVFIAHDERDFPGKIEALLAKKSFAAERRMLGNWPSGISAATGMTFFTDSGETVAQVGSSRETLSSAFFVDGLAAAFGEARCARAAIIAHEWAHCWQHKEGLPFAELAALEAQRLGFLLAEPALAFVADFKARQRYRLDEDELAADALGQAEEGFCDLVGAWAASHIAGRNLAEAFAAHRDEWSAGMTRRCYDTGAILRGCLPVHEPMPESFDDLVARASERLPAIAAAVFHPAPCPRAAPGL